MPCWLIIIFVMYFGCNLFCAVWLSKTSRGATTYINTFHGFVLVFLFGGLAGIATLIYHGINWLKSKK